MRRLQVRYLEKAVFGLDYGQLKLVFEALHERRRLLENAPHLTTSLPIMTVRSLIKTTPGPQGLGSNASQWSRSFPSDALSADYLVPNQALHLMSRYFV